MSGRAKDMAMGRIEREKRTVRLMVELYCRRKLGLESVPEEYRRLADYACLRLEHCRFGEKKGACKNCPVHCYAPRQREMIRDVMKWAGPRMLVLSPLDAIRHLLGS